MGVISAESLRGTLEQIERRLAVDAGGDANDRDTLKRDIIALVGQVDGAMADLKQLRDDIKRAADRYKQLPAPRSMPPTEPVAARASVQADHLGASTYIEKGWSLIALGDYPGAVQALERALALSPGATQAESLLGWAAMLNENYDDALATFSRVLMKDPANALARINVGYICLKKGIFGEAIEHLSKAIRLDNDRKAVLYAHYYLGLVYLEREMYEDAQTFFRKTLRLGPNLIEAYFELGRALWFAGEREEALRVWADGQRANRFNPWAKRCGEMLALASAGGDVPRTQVAKAAPVA
ncbi:MAG: tetratricopeptide repeat protein [Gemmatimonadales bacterium]|nr:tetratricopeptide repeat protein [Gemmatimonadales bacterium]